MKKQLWQIIFEFISIVFAVMLALGLNSYKQNLDLKSESALLTEKILIECERNFQEIDSVIIINEGYLTYLDSLRQIDDIEKVSSFQISFASELMTSSAWKFTQASNAYTFIDPEFLNEATILYEQQDYYMLISNQMFQNLGEMLINDLKSEVMVNTSYYYMSNMLATTRDLKQTYQEFLARFKKEPTPSSQ